MAVVLRSDPLSRIHPEPQTLEFDHSFSTRPAMSRPLVVAVLFPRGSIPSFPTIASSPTTNPHPSLPISLNLPPPVPSPPSSVSLEALGQFLGTKRSSGSSGSSSSSSSSLSISGGGDDGEMEQGGVTHEIFCFVCSLVSEKGVTLCDDQDPVLLSRSTVFEGRCFQNLERCGGEGRKGKLNPNFISVILFGLFAIASAKVIFEEKFDDGWVKYENTAREWSHTSGNWSGIQTSGDYRFYALLSARALSHKWFLLTGLALVFEFLAGLISRPAWWDLASLLPFSVAYFP
ncbi:unnamed protein product [Microthlaspi erraticum]|uniref:Uncharacterized protein n=1 Tax=Microthlaspi erraticum TaxID=1685480 RepID=A0A6D2IT82_9BRAS|nr:unnamed protein product [Microthlaspi erraticum]